MSRFDNLITDLEAAFNDATVNFVGGKVCLNKHATQRQAIFVRQRGILKFTSSPGRTPLSAPVAGVGTFTQQHFEREEQILVTLRAEDEEALDLLFDRIVNVIFAYGGPNFFIPDSPYEWFGDDSKQGGGWVRRNPSIRFFLTARLASRGDAQTYINVASTSADAGFEPSVDDTPTEPVTVVNP